MMNFELNLVPDVKIELLKKQRMRNFIVAICIIVGAASLGVVAILGSIVGGQNIALSVQDKEILCRSQGSDKAGECKDYGQAILKVENINQLLTIQDQMDKISQVNKNKMLLSRVFGLLDVMLPTGDDVVSISELSIDLPNTTLSFDAQGDSASNIDYRALEVFQKGIGLSYYDYGRYMRYDSESGSFVEIPTTCVDEVVENGVLYGIYHKGKPGCEASVLDSLAVADEGQEKVAAVDVKIKRVYATEDEKNNYKDSENEASGKYYFESECIKYSDIGIDAAATIEACPLSEEGASVRDSSNGRDSNGSLVLRFSAAIKVTEDIFKFENKHMRIVGPSRQNVTDSYTQIRDMFTARAEDCDPADADYQQCIGGA